MLENASVIGYVNPNGYFPTLLITILKKDEKLFGLWPCPRILELGDCAEEFVGKLGAELISHHTDIQIDFESPNLIAVALDDKNIELLEVEKIKQHIKRLVESNNRPEREINILNKICCEF